MTLTFHLNCIKFALMFLHLKFTWVFFVQSSNYNKLKMAKHIQLWLRIQWHRAAKVRGQALVLLRRDSAGVLSRAGTLLWLTCGQAQPAADGLGHLHKIKHFISFYTDVFVEVTVLVISVILIKYQRNISTLDNNIAINNHSVKLWLSDRLSL